MQMDLAAVIKLLGVPADFTREDIIAAAPHCGAIPTMAAQRSNSSNS
jgi:hypothetical protein